MEYAVLNTRERNQMVLACQDMIDRLSLSRSMSIPEDARDDVKQAGYLAAIGAAETYPAAKERGWDWLPWAKRYVVNAMVRERDKLRGWDEDLGTSIDIDMLLSVAASWFNRDDGDQDEFGSSMSEWAELLPRYNENDDEDLQKELIMGDLVEALYALPVEDRKLMGGYLVTGSVSEAGRAIGLTQSSADRAFQRILGGLRATLSAGNS